jgi:hypothetical protein
MEAKAYELEVDLAACSALLAKLCTSITPWDIQRRSAKLSDAKAQFDRSRAGVKALLTRLVMDSEYAKDAGERLRERWACGSGSRACTLCSNSTTIERQ